MHSELPLRVLMCTIQALTCASVDAAGKLFPGPHLYAGATMIALWGIAAAMVRFSLHHITIMGDIQSYAFLIAVSCSKSMYSNICTDALS